MTATGNGNLWITGVGEGTSAQEAGVQIQDQIIEIEGQAVEKLTPQRIAELAHKSEGAILTLKVQRKGEDKLREFKLKVRRLL